MAKQDPLNPMAPTSALRPAELPELFPAFQTKGQKSACEWEGSRTYKEDQERISGYLKIGLLKQRKLKVSYFSYQRVGEKFR